MEAQLSQEEIDRLFRERTGEDGAGQSRQPTSAISYDFRRPDRIPKEQLRSIHLMHDFLARNLASSLGAYLRAYISVNLVSVEQLSFGEFLQYLPTPTCIASIAMPPMDGNAVLEVNPSLIMPMIDILLGGAGTADFDEARELTDIEQAIGEGIYRIVLHDLKEAWAPVAEIDFSVDAMETQPQLMQILSSNEAIVAIGFEVTMGEARGMMNFGVPSIMVKMMGQKFEQQWSIRRRSGSKDEQRRMAKIARRVPLGLEAVLHGAKMEVREVLSLRPGDVVSLDLPLKERPDIEVGGLRKFTGEVVVAGNRRGVLVDSVVGSKSED